MGSLLWLSRLRRYDRLYLPRLGVLGQLFCDGTRYIG